MGAKTYEIFKDWFSYMFCREYDAQNDDDWRIWVAWSAGYDQGLEDEQKKYELYR